MKRTKRGLDNDFNRARFLVAHGADPVVWAKRHGIESFSTPCCVCGAVQTTSLPFASGQLRGLVAPMCACGHPNPPYCVVRDARFGDLFSGSSGGPTPAS